MKREPSTVSKAGTPADEPELDDSLAVVAEPQGEESKIKLIMGLLKKFVSVKDIANLRLSLPASLMAPVPNLEYWTVGDRADLLLSVGESPDPLERMLAALRFTFSRDLRFVRGNVCKPYNSVLGEHFRCNWEVPLVSVNASTKEPIINGFLHQPHLDDPLISGYNTPGAMTPGLGSGSETSSIKSRSSRSSMARAASGFTTPQTTEGVGSVKVAFLCEQVSHHPPISSAYYYCPSKGIESYNVDQISARVSGMTLRIGPGTFNKGHFIKLLPDRDGPGKGEEYQVTNPQANVNGLLKASFYGTISDSVTITCRGGDLTERYRTIIEYKDESWISKPRFLLEGVIYKYKMSEASTAESWTRIKEVPSAQVLGTIEGCWRTKIMWKPKGEKARLLLDMDILAIIPKNIRPLSSQVEFESQKLWDPVTKNMLVKNWGEATTEKQVIEQAQRDRAAEKKKTGTEHVPSFFETDITDGRPKLSEAGRKALQSELDGDGY